MPEINLNDFTNKDLEQMRLFINEKSRPTTQLTDKIWQKIFVNVKQNIVPVQNGETKRMVFKYSRAIINEFGEYEADQSTDWKWYCTFINSVLKEIRDGQISYCYYFYQITQLLVFHKDTLRTRYDTSEKQWEVWLNDRCTEKEN